MIHDATVEVTCDGEDCRESIYVDLPAGASNNYIADDVHIEKGIVAQDWIIENGKHFCCGACALSIGGEKRKRSAK